MNPYGLDRLARQRCDDVRKAAERRRALAVPRDPARSIRHRAGWALVHLGLSLISGTRPVRRSQARARHELVGEGEGDG